MMHNIFDLYSKLYCRKYFEENLLCELRDIKLKWIINGDQFGDSEEPPQSEAAACHHAQNDSHKPDPIDDEFYQQIDKLLAKAQESIKQDYLTINKTKPAILACK